MLRRSEKLVQRDRAGTRVPLFRPDGNKASEQPDSTPIIEAVPELGQAELLNSGDGPFSPPACPRADLKEMDERGRWVIAGRRRTAQPGTTSHQGNRRPSSSRIALVAPVPCNFD